MSEIVVDGESLPFVEGQTVAAALVAVGRVAWRTTRVGHRPRGVFCGIGVCFDCLVTIDGSGGQRACLVPARPGMTVTTGEGDDE
ncbi:(2Fe-2S)-binding protein [Streptomyces sp. NPDC086080]|uniref:(2Fe-2S)-binding protein n=1 Tax=Streptomyces sp. NPDC086080 TaxID=3365748 RepID=UPI0037CFD067